MGNNTLFNQHRRNSWNFDVRGVHGERKKEGMRNDYILSYLWFIQWNVEGNKQAFAGLSTFEFGCELTLLTVYTLIYICNRRNHKND